MAMFDTAEALAADLAGARVDVNEAQKVLAYLRSRPGDGAALFRYLEAVTTNGRAVIRSRQTMDYYRELHAACRLHLGPLRNDYPVLLQTYAWSLRLLRYYRAVPLAAEERHAQQRAEPERPTPQPTTTASAAPVLPVQGAIFTGKILAVDAETVLVKAPGFDQAAAVGVMNAAAAGGNTARYRVGNTARVEVVGIKTLKSGRVILALKPGPKKEQARDQ